LFDIPEVLALANRFLDVSGTDLRVVDTCDGRIPDTCSSDLLISNYAFSELHREVQEMYWERVVRNSSRGYVTYNHIAPPEAKSLTASEFAARIPGARVLPEFPLTHPANVIVVWGMRSKGGSVAAGPPESRPKTPTMGAQTMDHAGSFDGRDSDDLA
jgi:hypothetical protein